MQDVWPTGVRATVEAAAAHLRQQTSTRPAVALVLGSGLGSVAAMATDAITISTSEIRGYPTSTVSGHSGSIVMGRLEGVPCAIFVGRTHVYEGRTLDDVAFSVRLAHRLGATSLIATNAAGGISEHLRTGRLMLIAGHLSLTPLPGSAPSGGRRPIYDEAVLRLAEQVAYREGILVRRGVYAWACGPSYETPAEIRALRRAGADAVGMSTVPEILCAHRLGMSSLGISSITNRAAGLSPEALNHEEVLDAAAGMTAASGRLLRGLVRALAPGAPLPPGDDRP